MAMVSEIASNLANGKEKQKDIQSMVKKAMVSEIADNLANGKEKQKDIQVLKLNGTVGFDALPYQLVRKCQEKGFQFNIICVGETGLGKTTLIESLFNKKFDFQPCSHELNSVKLKMKTLEVSEGGFRVKLRVVETAGFGDQLDKDKSVKVIIDYINDQFESYLREELKIKRSLTSCEDTRIHACLYFISPTGHGLKALDVTTLRELSKRVNVIPVISKADTISKDELARFKQKIVSELKTNGIEIYQFPVNDETVRKDNMALNALVPFAIIGSTDFVEKEDGRSVRARRYPWGIVEVENEEHCDFVKLREAVLRVNQDALCERTHKVLYERYRRERLCQMKMTDGDAGPRMMDAFSQRQKELNDEFDKNEERLSKELEERVIKKEAELKRHDDIIKTKRREIDDRYKRELENLDEKIKRLTEEKCRLEKVKKPKIK